MTIVRRQFPLTLSYAITAHKAQGQTLSRILVDQRNDSFAHGQTYVTFGRACNRESVCVLIRPDRLRAEQDPPCALIRNVTYPGMLS
jgi:ATP-dependent DNA helicase PIF1